MVLNEKCNDNQIKGDENKHIIEAERNILEAIIFLKTALIQLDRAILVLLSKRNLVRVAELRCAQRFIKSSLSTILFGLGMN